MTEFGYTEREADFLRLAALLSGYFIRNQFNQFIGKECGALSQRFLNRGIGLGHLHVLPAMGGRRVYHVSAISVYRALSDPDNRNRRGHQTRTVRRHLMALDYALAHRDGTWLLSESDRTECLTTLGLSSADIPHQVFGATRRNFVYKQPTRLLPSGVPSFGFIDEGLRGFSQFELFLKTHRTMLKRLPVAEVVFAGADHRRSRQAEALYRRTIAGETTAGNFDVDRLRRYFVAKKLFNQKQFDQFDQSRLDDLRENKRVFSGPEVDRLFDKWLVEGDRALTVSGSSTTVFRTYQLPHSYEWLSAIRFR